MSAAVLEMVREARDSALHRPQIEVALLKDLDGLVGAYEGFLYFANGNEGHEVPDFPEFRLSERAAQFCGLV